MSSPLFCLLSCGNLKFLPFNSKKSVSDENVVKELKDTESLSLQYNKLSIPSPSNTSISSVSSSSRILASPTPEIIDLNNESILSSSHSAHSIYLPNHYITLSTTKDADTDSELKHQLFKMLRVLFPSWSSIDLEVKQLTGGITNMLLMITNTRTSEIVLVRTYGQGTNLIIDRDREFVSQLFLNSLDLASPIYGRFGNGLVYGFLSGRSLSPDELSHPVLYPLIAQRLGHWHNVIKSDDIYDGISKLRKLRGSNDSKLIKDVWELMRDWIRVLPDITALLDKCLEYKDILEVKDSNASLQQILTEELNWLIKTISHKSPTVSCHSDLLSGNVIIPDKLSQKLSTTTTIQNLGPVSENPISFIDYEYMLPLPRAFDISNHFMEWQGFECDKSKIPSPSRENQVMRIWAKLYLSSDNHEVLEEEVDLLIDEISVFYGMPGFYWGIWAGIQSTISIIDFDYKNYCCERLDEYFVWKGTYC